MDTKKQIKDLLGKKFEAQKIDYILNYFLTCVQKFEENDWENSLFKAGKFIEVIVKLLWTYCGKSLPTREKDFKAGQYDSRRSAGQDRGDGRAGCAGLPPPK
jgi:hypothetical protein